jgi:hypothetical protein
MLFGKSERSNGSPPSQEAIITLLGTGSAKDRRWQPRVEGHLAETETSAEYVITRKQFETATSALYPGEGPIIQRSKETLQ